MLFEQVHAPMDGSCMQLCCHTLLSLSLGGERPLSFVCRGSSAAAVRCRKGLLCLAVHAVLVRVSRVQPAYFHIGTWCAQVTNPPIDPLREGLVMSLAMRLGKRGNLLQPGPGAYTQLLLNSPVLLESELEAIKTGCALSSKVPAGSASAPSPATFLGPWHWSPQALAGILVPADAKACRGQPVLDGTSTHDLLLSALLCGVGATVQRQVVMYQGVLTPVAAVSSARRPSTCTTPAARRARCRRRWSACATRWRRPWTPARRSSSCPTGCAPTRSRSWSGRPSPRCWPWGRCTTTSSSAAPVSAFLTGLAH